MVFCCIAIVGVAIIYFAFLTAKQLFSGMRRDRQVSDLPAPPRALTGNGSQPVFGHTWLFTRLGGDIAREFPSHWREIRWLPRSWSRRLGKMFSIFIWGQWRVVIQGPSRVKHVLNHATLKEGWAWSPPVTLLGKSCMPLLEEKERMFLGEMLASPLSQKSVLKLAPEFAEIAEQFVEDLVAGKLRRGEHRGCQDSGSTSDYASDLELAEEGITGSQHVNSQHSSHKIRFEALRSYTFDLIDGPILRMDKWNCRSKQSQGESTTETEEIMDDVDSLQKTTKERETKGNPSRSTMMLWMDRLKRAMCVIKMTFGAEWMYIWILNEYGRAVNARMYLEKQIMDHVSKRAKLAPVKRLTGHTVHDPMAMPFPIITLAENVLRRNETVTGENSNRQERARANSDSLQSSAHFLQMLETADEESNRGRSRSSPDVLVMEGDSTEVIRQKPALSVLDRLLLEKDSNDSGLTHSVIAESSILLWMILDAGNAWTAMAMNLLALDESACETIQREIDEMISIHGRDKLFTPKVLDKMENVDGLIWDAVRLTPQFLGGMKVVDETVEMKDCGVQIPRNTNVIFSQPTEEGFDLSRAKGKKPHTLGQRYPCPELHGFLPFQGQEVPLMVLQTKVFIITLLQKFSPFLSKRSTFYRKIKSALGVGKKSGVDRRHSLNDLQQKSTVDEDFEVSSIVAESESERSASPTRNMWASSRQLGDTTQSAALKLFTKIPFPEPRRVLNVHERRSSLEILGVTHLGH